MESGTKDAVVEEVCPNVYDITWERADEGSELVQGYRWRSFLFDFPDDKTTLVDTCLSNRFDRLVAGINEIGSEPERLLITHNHPDHVDAFDEVVDRYDPETWVPEKDRMDQPSDEIEYPIPVSTPADNLFTDGEQIGRFEAAHIGGHTPGNSVFVDEQAGILVCGDALNGSDRRGLPPGYMIHPPQSTHGSRPPQAVVDAEENIVDLLDYEFDVALMYHGSSVFEDAREKLYNYINFEPNYSSDRMSLHRRSRGSHPKISSDFNLEGYLEEIGED